MAVINFAIGYIDAQGIPANQMQDVKEKIAKAGAKVEKKIKRSFAKTVTKEKQNV